MEVIFLFQKRRQIKNHARLQIVRHGGNLGKLTSFRLMEKSRPLKPGQKYGKDYSCHD